jgi:hypothetical protein
VMSIMPEPLLERHKHLLFLHNEVIQPYRIVLSQLSTKDVQQPLPNHSDRRTISEIVAHIAVWDRFAVLSAGDILAGISHPRMVTDLSGYCETDGTFPTFANINDFNEYHAHKYQNWPWDELCIFAIDNAMTLYTLFAHPQLVSAARLEQTEPYRKRLKNGAWIENITMGWSLWLTMIEHLAVEHSVLLDGSNDLILHKNANPYDSSIKYGDSDNLPQTDFCL